MNYLDISEIVQLVAVLIASLSIVIAACTYVAERIRCYQATVHTIYRDVDESFIEVHKLLLGMPGLKISVYDTKVKCADLTDAQRRDANLMFDIINSCFERTFTFFMSAPVDMRASQWPGWKKYMGRQCRNEVFRDWWKDETGYDMGYCRFMRDLIYIVKSGIDSGTPDEEIDDRIAKNWDIEYVKPPKFWQVVLPFGGTQVDGSRRSEANKVAEARKSLGLEVTEKKGRK
ncbi:MAG: hypothetical protein RLO80_04390 [Hyphomonas sp.]